MKGRRKNTSEVASTWLNKSRDIHTGKLLHMTKKSRSGHLETILQLQAVWAGATDESKLTVAPQTTAWTQDSFRKAYKLTYIGRPSSNARERRHPKE